jgi:hypothetical protein
MNEQVFGDKQAEVSIDRLELRQAQRGAGRLFGVRKAPLLERELRGI